jgi:hypothetical protein
MDGCQLFIVEIQQVDIVIRMGHQWEILILDLE